LLYAVLASATVVAHLAFLLFVTLGGLLVVRRRRVAWLHLPAVLWGVYVELAGKVCPLTPLENWARRRAGGEGYGGGFIEHYLIPVLYPPGLTPGIQLALGVGLLSINVGIYAWIFLRRKDRVRSSGGS
jgi:hypothetical protein